MYTGKTTVNVTLGGQEYTITKLKAGKFYEAQKLFSDILASVGANPSGDKEGTAPGLAQFTALLNDFPEKVTKFVALCMELDEEELKAKAYPEEISEAFGACIELNNVFENLKNSVAPMEKLAGQEKAEAKK